MDMRSCYSGITLVQYCFLLNVYRYYTSAPGFMTDNKEILKKKKVIYALQGKFGKIKSSIFIFFMCNIN